MMRDLGKLFFEQNSALLEEIKQAIVTYVSCEDVPVFFEGNGYLAKLLKDPYERHSYLLVMHEDRLLVFHQAYDDFGKEFESDDKRFSWDCSLLEKAKDPDSIYSGHILFSVPAKSESPVRKATKEVIARIVEIFNEIKSHEKSPFLKEAQLKELVQEQEQLLAQLPSEDEMDGPRYVYPSLDLMVSDFIDTLRTANLLETDPLDVGVAISALTIKHTQSSVDKFASLFKAGFKLCEQYGYKGPEDTFGLQGHAFSYNDLDNLVGVIVDADTGREYLAYTDQNLGFLVDFRDDKNFAVYGVDQECSTGLAGGAKASTSLKELMPIMPRLLPLCEPDPEKLTSEESLHDLLTHCVLMVQKGKIIYESAMFTYCLDLDAECALTSAEQDHPDFDPYDKANESFEYCSKYHMIKYGLTGPALGIQALFTLGSEFEYRSSTGQIVAGIPFIESIANSPAPDKAQAEKNAMAEHMLSRPLATLYLGLIFDGYHRFKISREWYQLLRETSAWMLKAYESQDGSTQNDCLVHGETKLVKKYFGDNKAFSLQGLKNYVNDMLYVYADVQV